jgi:hypothetical protein
MGTMGAVSSHSKASYGDGWDQGPEQASSGGLLMSKPTRTPGNIVAQDKNNYARGHNLESVMDVEVPLTIDKKDRNYHMKKVTDDILE